MAVALFGLVGTGCGLRPVRTPIPSVHYPPRSAQPAGDLVVVLPGFGDRPRTFEREGLVATLQDASPGTEILVVDAHYGYYARRVLPRRIVQDVLIPAKARGQRVWLVGVSMGGFGALLTAKKHPDLVDGLVLLSPYLGHNDVQMEIARAGGLRRWEPPAVGNDHSIELWRWLKGYASGASRPPLVVGYATGERLSWGIEQLVPVLDRDLVVRTSGRHEWATWRRLWPDVLARLEHRGWLLAGPPQAGAPASTSPGGAHP